MAAMAALSHDTEVTSHIKDCNSMSHEVIPETLVNDSCSSSDYSSDEKMPNDKSEASDGEENQHEKETISEMTDVGLSRSLTNGETPELLNEEDDDVLEELERELPDGGARSGGNEELGSLRAEVANLKSSNQQLQSQLHLKAQEYEDEMACLKQTIAETKTQNQTLHKTIGEHLKEIKVWKDRVDTNDKSARKAIEGYKSDYQASIDKLTKKYNECKQEKENMVVKYAQSEAKVMQLQSTVDKLEAKVKEKEREKELLAEKLRSQKADAAKQSSSSEDKSGEVATLKKDLEAQKETITSLEYRTKWAQNKLKSELDAHKDTKAKLEEMNRRYNETKEECVTIRTNCQEMIKTYQESEEIKSNSLDIELKKREKELQEITESLAARTKDVEDLVKEKAELRSRVELLGKQSGAGEAKVEELEVEKERQSKELEDLNSCIKCLREENSQIRTKLLEMQSMNHDLQQKEHECEELKQKITSMDQEYKDFYSELESCKQRDDDMLQLTQKMTERNTILQSENSALQSKLAGLELTSTQQKAQIEKLEEILKLREVSSCETHQTAKAEIKDLQAKIAEKDAHIRKVEEEIQGLQTEIRTLKKKQASAVKELSREVQTLRRQLEVHETKHLDDTTGGSLPNRQQLQNSHGKPGSAPVSLTHSRTNSTSSLDRHSDGWVIVNTTRQGSPPESTRTLHQQISSGSIASTQPVPSESDIPETSFLEPDKQKLIEKIVKLQRALARKNEKLDFCEDHIRQLVEEVQKKSRIIQNYVMREEAGALSSDDMDRHKTSIARKGGIMASINSMHAQDGKMSLELSLQINHKLQAVLEDTLLKNITLKESMDTLGQEIARMSAENSTLQGQITKGKS